MNMAKGSESGKTPSEMPPVQSTGISSSNQEAELARRMADLSDRLDTQTAKAGLAGGSIGATGSDSAGMGQGFKAAADLSGGVIVGVILGLGLDRIAGSSPWGLIVFLLLGFSAGVLNMLRGFGMAVPKGSGRPPRQD